MTNISESPQDDDSESQGPGAGDAADNLGDDDGAVQASDPSQAATTETGSTGPTRGANLGHKH